MITSVEPLAMMRPKDSLGSAVEPRRETHRSERERLAGARTAGVSRAVSSFKPGRSGNSGGRPKAEVRALLPAPSLSARSRRSVRLRKT
jgi:hypothetical protein